jgi:adenylosuccinate synthase
MRQAELFGEWWDKMCDDHFEWGDNNEFTYVCTSKEWDIIKDKIVVLDTMMYVNDAIDNNMNVLIEGSQGCDLDLNYGLDYPNTTSRQCHASQLVADCGISPRSVDQIIMVMRPYPIRISNTTNLTDENGENIVASSGGYCGAEEINWDIIKGRCGAPDDVEFGEMTTVTKKMRRVFEMNWDRLQYVSKLNRPTGIALNFAQYIDWDAYKCKSYKDLPVKVLAFIKKVEEITGVPVVLIGTGPDNEDIIDLR